MRAELDDETDFIVVQFPINPKKKKEQIMKMVIEKDILYITSVKQLHPDHWVVKDGILDINDYFKMRDTIRYINRKKE